MGGKADTKIQWITASLNEASIDSPSFRAYINTYHTKVVELEDWIKAYGQFNGEKIHEASEQFKASKRKLAANILPPPSILSNGFAANQTYSSTIAQQFNKDYDKFLKKIFNVLFSAGIKYDTLVEQLYKETIEPYNLKRRNFEFYQSKLDKTLTMSQGLPNNDENMQPLFLKEENEQIYEIKKSYLDASLTLIRTISNVQLDIDKFVIEIIDLINKQNEFPVKESMGNINLAPEMEKYATDYADWVRVVNKYAVLLFQHLKQAHAFIYSQVLKSIKPSNDEKDYIAKNDFYSLSDADCFKVVAQREAGWLYMKTFVGEDNREVWVKRWCFISDLIFGIFLLSPEKTGVEETDKFGMGLITVSNLQNASQRFTFEVKIKGAGTKGDDLFLNFQAENLFELKKWIQAFKKSKQKYLSLKEDKEDVAFAEKRYSPRFLEFASSTTTVVDQQLVSFSKKETTSLIENLKSTLKSNQIESLIEQRSFDFKTCSAPISTKFTPLALLAGSFINKNNFYDAIQANIWGVNILNQNGGVFLKEGEKDNADFTSDVYPKNYSNALKVSNIQFKTIFESINYHDQEGILKYIDEPLLFKFSAIWSANKTQKFASVFHVTQNYLYVYMNFVGFAHLSRHSFKTHVSVEYDENVKNFIKLYSSSNYYLKFFVCFDNNKAVATKLQHLVELAHDDTKSNTEKILDKFKVIDNLYKEQEDFERTAFKKEGGLETEYSLGKTFWDMSSSSRKLTTRTNEIKKYYSKTYTKAYNISSKGLCHIMFGDHSNVFPDCLFFADKENNYNTNWYWKKETDKNGNVQLVRNIQFKLNRTDGFLSDSLSELSATQRIIGMVENRYYEIDQDPLILKIPFCHKLKIGSKFIITACPDPENASQVKLQLLPEKSILHVNYKWEFLDTQSLNIIERLVESFALRVSEMEASLFRRAIHYYLDKIGSHGKTVRAIQLGGLLGVVSNDEDKSKDITDDNVTKALNMLDDDSISSSEVLSQNNVEESIKTNMNKKATYDIKYTYTILFRALLKIVMFRVLGAIFTLIRVIIMIVDSIKNIWSEVNKTILVGLIISLFVNIFLFGRSSVAYWSVMKANSIFDQILRGGSKNGPVMERALYIKDVDLLQDFLVGPEHANIFQKFSEDMGISNNKFRESRKDLAIKRNELLVELRILQNMEKELVHGDYKKFLIKEIEKCRQTAGEYPIVWQEDKVIQKYCNDCSNELEKIGKQLL